MIINMLVLLVLFVAFARLLKPKFEPSEQFSARWLKACIVAALSVGVYLFVVAIKELTLFTLNRRAQFQTWQSQAALATAPRG